MHNILDSVIPNLRAFFGGGPVEVTVTYEELLSASEDALGRVRVMEERCQEARSYINNLVDHWTSEACDRTVQRLRDKLEAIEEMLRRFRKHAENLQQIAQKYIATAGEISDTVEGLSSDVIV